MKTLITTELDVLKAQSEDWKMSSHGDYNMGSQILLAPVEWTKNGWFKVPDSFGLEKPLKAK